jgi:methylated-DNA-[protein]-cysteine S-methyltransferase
MYSRWPTKEELHEYAMLDHTELQKRAATYFCTALTTFEVPLLFGDFILGASAFGASTLFFPGSDDFDIADRFDYYRLGHGSTGNKMAIEVGIELMGYSAGDLQVFKTPVDLSYLSPFQQDVLLACRKIPFGETRTSRELAAMAGHPGKGGAAAAVLRHNPLPILVPCHRVLPVNQTLGAYCGDLRWKQYLLEHEGVDKSLVMA